MPEIVGYCRVSTDGQTLDAQMREALLFVIVVAMVATGLWLFVAGLFFENETNMGGDRLWRDFVAPFLGFEEG